MVDLVKLATVPDWITPTVGFIQDALNGPSYTFEMEEGSWWSGVDVERLLKEAGVESWAWMGLPYPESGFVFSVHESQAEWAWHIMQQHGVPLR